MRSALLALALCGCSDESPTEQLDFLTASLPDGRVGVAYEAQLVAVGGSGAVRYGVGGGALPDGLTLSIAGVLEGTPAVAGTFAFAGLARDAHNHVALHDYAIEVAPGDPEPPPPLRWVTTALPVGSVGTWYEAPLRAEGGVPPMRFGAVHPLPAGIAIGADEGLLYGTPERAEVSTLDLDVTDAEGTTRALSLELRVVPALDLVTELLPIAQVGVAYEAHLETVGGAFPVVVEAFSGQLPEGLDLDPSGVVAGVPSEVASRPVRFRATDGIGETDDQRIRLWVVADAPVETWPDVALPPNCGLDEPVTVQALVPVEAVAMIERASFAIDLDYEDVGMLEVAVAAPDGTRVLLHRGGGRGGGGDGLHYMFEDDTSAWGSLAPLVGLGPAGDWTFEVTVLPDPGFGCVADPGRLQRVAVVLHQAGPAEEYLRILGWSANNMIDGPFARISGGGLDQSSFDLVVERWSTGANGLPEGGTGDDARLADPGLTWSTDLPPEVGVLAADGAFVAGGETGVGTMVGTAGETSIELPISVVAPDWVP